MVAMAEQRFLTVDEAAAELRVSERTVLNWLRSGRLPGMRLGGPKSGWRIERTDFERFLDELRRESAAGRDSEA